MSEVERIAVVKFLVAEFDAGNVSADEAIEAIDIVMNTEDK